MENRHFSLFPDVPLTDGSIDSLSSRTFDLAVEASGAALHHLHVFDDRAESRLTLRLLLVLQTLEELVIL